MHADHRGCHTDRRHNGLFSDCQSDISQGLVCLSIQSSDLLEIFGNCLTLFTGLWYHSLSPQSTQTQHTLMPERWLESATLVFCHNYVKQPRNAQKHLPWCMTQWYKVRTPSSQIITLLYSSRLSGGPMQCRSTPFIAKVMALRISKGPF